MINLKHRVCEDSGSRQHNLYAIGDVHGQLNMLERLFKAIDEDNLSSIHCVKRPRVIMTGDYVDRGPNSKGVIELLTSEKIKESFDLIPLVGNHDYYFAELINYPNSKPFVQYFISAGGNNTALSYGINNFTASYDSVIALVQMIPQHHIDFLQNGLHLTYREDNYLFVHAGIDPDRSLQDQSILDLIHIREPFLSHQEDYGFIVVHGHSITSNRQIQKRRNRICIDTGAFISGGALSAVCIRPDNSIEGIRIDVSSEEVVCLSR